MHEQDDVYLDSGVRGWIFNMARKNYHRVARWYEFDDLVQDGYLCFAKCRKSFKFTMDEPTPDNRKEFMAFFQRAFQNHIVDLANYRTKVLQDCEVSNAALSENQLDAITSWAETTMTLEEGTFAVMLKQAPAEILEVLKLILIDGVANVPYKKTRLRKKDYTSGATSRMVKGRRNTRETTAEHYDRCLGRSGVVAQLREYFLGERGSVPSV